MGDTEETKALRAVASMACLMAAQLFDNGAGFLVADSYTDLADQCSWLGVRIATEQAPRLGYEAVVAYYRKRMGPGNQGWGDPRLQVMEEELARRWERWQAVAAQRGNNYAIVVTEPGAHAYLTSYLTTDLAEAKHEARLELSRRKSGTKAVVTEAWSGKQVWPEGEEENDEK